MTGSGYCPFAERITIPPTNYAVGNDATLAACLHIMNSGIQSCISWFKSPVSGVSAHFGIGKDGRLVQFVSIRDTAYAQGLNYDRQTGKWFTFRDKVRKNVRPTWGLLTPGMSINRHVISIEHEGKPGEPLTPAMTAMQTRVLKWIAEQTGLVYVAGSTLIGHFNLDNIDRAYCPGSAFNFAEIAMAANATVEPDWVQRWGVAVPYFAE